MEYCRVCVTPSTRPNIKFDQDGVCNRSSTVEKRSIDWDARERAFREVVAHARARSKGHDCLIPVSGGKDSTWQVVKCLEYGLKPLAVTWKTPARTDLGARNLQNLIDLGVDHIDYQISPKVERKLVYQTLVKHGSTAIPMHLALFSIPLQVAYRFEIPLVVWGENSAFEYGGEEEERTGFRLDSSWLRKFGVTHGTTAADWVGPELSRRDLTSYFAPTDEQLEKQGILAVFLGYYFPWDPETSLSVARKHGFTARAEGPRTGYYNYADIDDDFISIHHWLKWYKFGFTRTYDNLSLEVHNGRMTRDQAIEHLRRTGDETPHGDIEKLCAWLGISRQHFYEVIEKFRNHEIWKQRAGVWMIDDFLIPDWRWQ